MEVNHEVANPLQILPLHGNECHLGHGVGRVRACGNTRTRPTDGYGDSGAASDRNRAADACPGDAAPDGNRAANERCAAAARPPRVYFSLGGELDPVLCHCEPPKAAALYSARNLCRERRLLRRWVQRALRVLPETHTCHPERPAGARRVSTTQERFFAALRAAQNDS